MGSRVVPLTLAGEGLDDSFPIEDDPSNIGWRRVIDGVARGSAIELASLLDEGWVARDGAEQFGVYRMVHEGVTTIGVMCIVAATDARSASERITSGRATPLLERFAVQLDPVVIELAVGARLPSDAERALGERPLHHFQCPDRITHTYWALGGDAAENVAAWAAAATAAEVVGGMAALQATTLRDAQAPVLALLVARDALRTRWPAPRAGLVAWIAPPNP